MFKANPGESLPPSVRYGVAKASCENTMCEQCDQIDEKLTRNRFMARWTSDPETLNGLEYLTAKYEARKRVLHPPEK
jgi:hypothetical protein